MPGQGKYKMWEADLTRKEGLGSADQSVMQKIFAQSPIAKLTNKDLIEIAKKYLTADASGGVQKGYPEDWPSGEVNLNFVGSPQLTKPGVVPVGGGGLPSTAWSPNLNSPATSPAGGTTNPSDVTPMDPIAIPEPTGGAVIGIGGLADPSVTAAEVSSTTLGESLTLGRHPGSK